MMICEYCKKEFKPNNSKRKYCSQECFNKARVKHRKELIPDKDISKMTLGEILQLRVDNIQLAGEVRVLKQQIEAIDLIIHPPGVKQPDEVKEIKIPSAPMTLSQLCGNTPDHLTKEEIKKHFDIRKPCDPESGWEEITA